MATVQQIQDLNHFIETLPASEREVLSIDEIYDLWREQAFRTEDLLAIEASLCEFKNGERGRPLNQFLDDFNTELLERKASEGK